MGERVGERVGSLRGTALLGGVGVAERAAAHATLTERAHPALAERAHPAAHSTAAAEQPLQDVQQAAATTAAATGAVAAVLAVALVIVLAAVTLAVGGLAAVGLLGGRRTLHCARTLALVFLDDRQDGRLPGGGLRVGNGGDLFSLGR